ncbi:GTPase activating protein for Arf [Spironucleus salmonicida]|uniref:GTPase activating protein for Arf n=1 Tax=Spironucleus salmonicida TaxID=348837 RepID=V6LHI0_9EUKA|nr:GTPase activating protein for Arf [Spironucleus salmonicida]|eukprot:EST44025.1 GTPase activating protein for Arf [Spironucleus salmonicida]
MEDFRQIAIDFAKQQQCCHDCSSSNPTWCSVRLGIFLCINCAGKHRSYGVAVSFMKSVDLDKWSQENVKLIISGGNKKFETYCKSLSITKPINYPSVSDGLQPYRDLLQKSALKDLVQLMNIPEISYKFEDQASTNTNQTTIQQSVITNQQEQPNAKLQVENYKQEMQILDVKEMITDTPVITKIQNASCSVNLNQPSGRKGLGKIIRKK